MKKSFPTLYKVASTGSTWSWTISVDGNEITESWGQIDGKQQTTTDVIKSGKNVGRANETTPEEQALSEAQSKWEKKLKAGGYAETRDKAEAGESSDLVEGGILPMLAQKFRDRGEKIKYPAYAQPKLDGHRIIAVCSVPKALENKASLWSRTRKQMHNLPHIVKAIEDLWKVEPLMGAFHLDGEGYNHAYHKKFEELTHFLRQPEPMDGCEIVQYHVYDAPISGTFRERHEMLKSLFKKLPKGSPLVLVETIEVNSEEELMEAFERFLAEGYEGAMVRNADGLYVGKRSNDLQKIKEFDDAEFEVVDVNEGKGRMQGHAVFRCRTKDKSEFDVKMKGKLSDLKQYFKDPGLAVGKMLTVQYQGLTNKNGVPRFPVGLRLRQDV